MKPCMGGGEGEGGNHCLTANVCGWKHHSGEWKGPDVQHDVPPCLHDVMNHDVRCVLLYR